jgi:hypothetical protein
MCVLRVLVVLAGSATQLCLCQRSTATSLSIAKLFDVMPYAVDSLCEVIGSPV